MCGSESRCFTFVHSLTDWLSAIGSQNSVLLHPPSRKLTRLSLLLLTHLAVKIMLSIWWKLRRNTISLPSSLARSNAAPKQPPCRQSEREKAQFTQCPSELSITKGGWGDNAIRSTAKYHVEKRKLSPSTKASATLQAKMCPFCQKYNISTREFV